MQKGGACLAEEKGAENSGRRLLDLVVGLGVHLHFVLL
jgi:hypothetical protein